MVMSTVFRRMIRPTPMPFSISPGCRILAHDQDQTGAHSEVSYAGDVLLGLYVLHDNPDIGPADEHLCLSELSDSSWELRWEESCSIWPGTGGVGDRGFDDAVIRITTSRRQNAPGARSDRRPVWTNRRRLLLDATASRRRRTAQSADLQPGSGAASGCDDRPRNRAVQLDAQQSSRTGRRMTSRCGSRTPMTLTDTETFTVTVNEVNLPPQLDPIGDRSTDVGTELVVHRHGV